MPDPEATTITACAAVEESTESKSTELPSRADQQNQPTNANVAGESTTAVNTGTANLGTDGHQKEEGEQEKYNPEEEVVEGDWNRREVEVREVKVHTGEEDEEVFWHHRAKLYRWAPDIAEPDTFIWKERGLGDARMLRHKTTGQVRFLLRQEKTLKIVANHYIISTSGFCNLRPNSGSDKIWVWSVNDFADDEMKLEQFALRFGTVEYANEFKEKWEDACKLNAEAFGVQSDEPEVKS